MIYASRVAGRADGADRYYKDRQWLNAWAGTDALFFRPTYLDIDQRAAFFQYVYSLAPAMVNDTSTMVPSIAARIATATAICLTAATTTNCTCRRLYGSETAFFDQTWKPDDVVKVK